MKQYLTTQIVSLNTGRVLLDADQARRRKNSVRDDGDPPYSELNPLRSYTIQRPTQFKAGELVGYDGPVNKLLMQSLEIDSAPPVLEPVTTTNVLTETIKLNKPIRKRKRK